MLVRTFPYMNKYDNYLGNKEVKAATEEYCENRCSQEFRKIHWKTPVPEPYFQQSCRVPATLLKKETGTVFSGEFSEISENTFFIEHNLEIAS